MAVQCFRWTYPAISRTATSTSFSAVDVCAGFSFSALRLPARPAPAPAYKSQHGSLPAPAYNSRRAPLPAPACNSRRALLPARLPAGLCAASDYSSRQAPRRREYITQAAPRRRSAHAPPRAGLLLPHGRLRRVLAMESYDVIANQPVVIDNVSAGGRASRERGGPAIPLSSGRPRPARRHPPTSAGPAAASGPRTAPYGGLGGRGRCASASRDSLGRLAVTCSGAAAPRWGAQPPPPPSCLWLGGAARPYWLGQLSVSGTARCYLLERGGTVARAPALIGSRRCLSGGASPGPAPPLFVPGGQWGCWARPWPHSQQAARQALVRVPAPPGMLSMEPQQALGMLALPWAHAGRGGLQLGTPHRRSERETFTPCTAPPPVHPAQWSQQGFPCLGMSLLKDLCPARVASAQCDVADGCSNVLMLLISTKQIFNLCV